MAEHISRPDYKIRVRRPDLPRAVSADGNQDLLAGSPSTTIGIVPKDQPRRMRSLTSTAGFEAFVIDQLSELGEVVARKMFGGIGLYCDALFFGIIARDELYLKVDDQTRGAFEAAGASPFRPYHDRPGSMQYYAVPLEVLESAPELARWARRALETAARATRPDPPKQKRRTGPARSKR